MKPRHIVLATFVAVIWGLAYVATGIALDDFSPPQLTALHFLIAYAPILFLPRLAIPWGTRWYRMVSLCLPGNFYCNSSASPTVSAGTGFRRQPNTGNVHGPPCHTHDRLIEHMRITHFNSARLHLNFFPYIKLLRLHTVT
jgi:hypothetical protein